MSVFFCVIEIREINREWSKLFQHVFYYNTSTYFVLFCSEDRFNRCTLCYASSLDVWTTFSSVRVVRWRRWPWDIFCNLFLIRERGGKTVIFLCCILWNKLCHIIWYKQCYTLCYTYVIHYVKFYAAYYVTQVLPSIRSSRHRRSQTTVGNVNFFYSKSFKIAVVIKK